MKFASKERTQHSQFRSQDTHTQQTQPPTPHTHYAKHNAKHRIQHTPFPNTFTSSDAHHARAGHMHVQLHPLLTQTLTIPSRERDIDTEKKREKQREERNKEKRGKRDKKIKRHTHTQESPRREFNQRRAPHRSSSSENPCRRHQ